MDTIIPIIFALAFFIFQAYLNYKKEQEKAKKRNPGKPQEHSVENEEPSIELSDWLQEILQPKVDQPSPHRQEKPIQPVVQARQPIEVIPEKYQPEKYQQVRYQPSEVPVDLLYEYRNLPEKQ